MHSIRRPLSVAASYKEKLRPHLLRADRFYRGRTKANAQRQFDFPPLAAIAPNVIARLRRVFRNKCAYCETPIGEAVEAPFDHFRPRGGAINADGRLSREHYWWLFGAWTNLNLCCAECNRCKGSRFPVVGRRARRANGEDGLLAERRLLLDPCSDKPEDVLVFTDDGIVASDDERGRITIETFDLNRAQLVQSRRDHALVLKRQYAVARARKELRGFLARSSTVGVPFRALTLQLLKRWALDDQPSRYASKRSGQKKRVPWPPDLKRVQSADAHEARRTRVAFERAEEVREQFSLHDASKRKEYFARTRYVERIEVRNFRAIEELDLDLTRSPDRNAPWFVLLGENGVGKSSVLQAVALALVDAKQRRELVPNPGKLVRHGARVGEICVHLTGDSKPIRLRFRRGKRSFDSESASPRVLVLGYGATRHLAGTEGTKRVASGGFSRAANLFSPLATLIDANAFLLRTPYLDLVARAFRDLRVLGEPEVLKKKVAENEVVVADGRQETSLRQLSEGYQSVVALSVDIISVLTKLWKDELRVAEGIVLLDEIEIHLHPRWKMEIVTMLREAFPRVQFICSTHDPLCLRGLRDQEVAVLKRDRNGSVHALADLPSPEKMRVDQLLTSEHFGLRSAVDPAVERVFSEYYALLAEERLSRPDRVRMRELKKTLADNMLMGSTTREREMLQIADRYLALRERESSREKRASLTLGMQKRLLAAWRT